MMTHVLDEIKSAWDWTKQRILSFLRWIFRWFFRLGLMGILCFGFAGGFYGFMTLLKVVFPVSSIENPSPVAKEKQALEPLREMQSPSYLENQKITIPNQIQSAWSVLRNIVRDIKRYRKD